MPSHSFPFFIDKAVNYGYNTINDRAVNNSIFLIQAGVNLLFGNISEQGVFLKMKINLKDKNTKEILMFSLLPFGTSTLYTLIGTALNMYFTDVLGLSLAMTSIVLSATKIWDAINDPLMGMIVDKTHTKNGKCRP